MTDLSPHVLPERYLTADVPPIGGVIKARPEDFVVEELPLYDPAGEGEHVYLMVEKRGLSAIEMNRVLARHFRVPSRAIGYAGLKDKQAVTRQVISIHMPGRDLASVPSLEHPKLAILWADRHHNKLRRGHLAGNRFSIRVRGVEVTRALDAKRVLDTLRRLGVPDRVGEQRFGYLANNHLIGRALFLRRYEEACDLLCGPASSHVPDSQSDARDLYAAGEFAAAKRAMPRSFATEREVLEALAAGETPEQAVTGIDPGLLAYYFSAFQSAVFNAALDRRLEAGLLGELIEGDIACAHPAGRNSRKFFPVDDVTLAQPDTRLRLDRVEISPTGPMWGTAMPRGSGRADQADVEALARFGLAPRDLERVDDAEMTRGTRRPFRVPIRNVEVEGGVDEHGAYIRCAFDLPRGAFATTVMAEIMKPAAPPPAANDREEPGDA